MDKLKKIFYLFFSFESIDELIKYVNTPNKLANWMKLQFDYLGDFKQFGKEKIKSPKEMLTKDRYYGRGDCDDFSRFSWEVLFILGYKPHIVNIYPEHLTDGIRVGHSICVFEYNKSYHMINDYYLIDLKIKGLDYAKIGKKIYSDWLYVKEYSPLTEEEELKSENRKEVSQ